MCLLNNSFPMYYHLSYCVLSKNHACKRKRMAPLRTAYMRSGPSAGYKVQSCVMVSRSMDDRSHDRNCINSVLIN